MFSLLSLYAFIKSAQFSFKFSKNPIFMNFFYKNLKYFSPSILLTSSYEQISHQSIYFWWPFCLFVCLGSFCLQLRIKSNQSMASSYSHNKTHNSSQGSPISSLFIFLKIKQHCISIAQNAEDIFNKSRQVFQQITIFSSAIIFPCLYSKPEIKNQQQKIYTLISDEDKQSIYKKRISIVTQQFQKSKMTTSIQFTSKKQEHSDTFDSLQSQDTAVLSKFRKNVFTSLSSELLGTEKICQKVTQWALNNDVNHYSFLSFPYNSAACEKQQSLLDIKYIYSNGVVGEPRVYLDPSLFIKGEADGSSFPSGGLRKTHRARAYNIWDQASEIFLRKKSKVAYIPSLLLTHSGQALDDMTIFRKSEAVMKDSASKMLTALGIPHKDVFLALGLEQEFFVVPKKAYLQRQDLRFVGRCLFGRIGAKSQQFSDHYYGKIPQKIEQILKEVQNELLEIGIPFKTKHNEVGNNQFEFCAIYQQAGKAIFHNLVTMEILEEIFDSHGYTVLLHEKPFTALNGSGKHANWSINYVTEQNQIKNMFSVPSGNDHELFKLFILITLSALKRNNALYFGAIAPPGNEIRLGGHQAPPRIISAYLGQTVSALIDGKERPQKKNLKETVFSLPFDVHQEDTDRNRTSPYAYTGHKFEFRALGASQNGGFPMAVIAATLAKEFKLVTEKLGNGVAISEIINELHQYTQSVRFQDDGYSEEWAIEAKQRGLYVNTEFIQILQKMSEQCKVFVEVGACNSSQIQARCEVMRNNYKLTVQTQAKTLLDIASQSIIPRSYAYLNAIILKSTRTSIMKYSQKFSEVFDNSLLAVEVLEESLKNCDSLKKASQLRKIITECGDHISKLCSLLQKSESLPDLEDFLLL